MTSVVSTLVKLSTLLLVADIFLVLIVARATPASPKKASLSEAEASSDEGLDFVSKPLGFETHPSTYYQPTKPLFTEYSFVGVQFTLPAGKVIQHAQEALDYVNNMPYVKYTKMEYLHQAQNTDNKTSRTPDQAWASGLNQILQYKIDSLDMKLDEVQTSISAHNVTPNSIMEVLNQHGHDIVKREINFNFDVTSAINTIFNGINAVFHWHSISQLTQSVNNIQVKVQHLEDFTIAFAQKIQSLLVLVKDQEHSTRYTLAAVLTAFMVIDEAESAMDILLQALTPLLQGVIPTIALDPKNLHTIYEKIASNAVSNGKRLALDSPNEMIKLTPFTFQRNNSWVIILSLPLVQDDNMYPGFNLVNMPVLHQDVPKIWDLPSLILGVKPTLYPQDSDYVVIETAHFKDHCHEFVQMFICNLPVLTTPSCPVDLYYNVSTHCKTKTLALVPIVMTATKELLFFFASESEVLIKCNFSWSTLKVKGLVRFEDRPGCTLTSETFTYTFGGTTPTDIFSQSNSRIIPDHLMPNSSIVDGNVLGKSFGKDIQESINEYNTSRTTLPLIPYTPVFGIIGMALGGSALLSVVILVVCCCVRANSPRAHD